MTSCRRFFAGILGMLILAGVGSTGRVYAQDAGFEKHVLTRDFLSEGVAAADVNADGRMDIIAGSYWFEAPAWTPRTFRSVKIFPDTLWADSFFNHAVDVNRDGRIDIVRVDFPGKGLYWYENPADTAAAWTMRRLHRAVNNESPRFVDIDRDGVDDLLFADGKAKQMSWLSLAGSDRLEAGERHSISMKDAPGTDRFSHGLGYGDINGDGRPDAIVRHGWWEAPKDPSSGQWTFHAADFGEPAAQMHTYDVDRDGDNDVVASSAHDYGIWWYEQQGEGDGTTWTRHLIHDEFSQTHGLVMQDMNGDALPDLVTGKRYFAHNGKDPGGHEPAVLYWFELTYENGTPEWIPHQIDDNSGIGVELEVQDITGDGRPDIAIANKNGVFLFEQTGSTD